MRTTTGSWLNWIAVLALVAGLGIGAIGLASAAGIWFGAWDFRTGFTLLQIADSYAAWISGACLAAAVIVTIFASRLHTGNALKLGALALAGSIAAGIAYYIPESHRPPSGTPGIHDVSTDTVDPPQYVAVLALRGQTSNTTVYGGSPKMTPQKLAELTTTAFPDLKTRHYGAPPKQVFERALAAVRDLGWDLVAAVPEEGRIEATDTTFWFRFKDDVVIRIRPDGTGSMLDARSLSRIGGGDAGANARRLRRFLAILDDGAS